MIRLFSSISLFTHTHCIDFHLLETSENNFSQIVKKIFQQKYGFFNLYNTFWHTKWIIAWNYILFYVAEFLGGNFHTQLIYYIFLLYSRFSLNSLIVTYFSLSRFRSVDRLGYYLITVCIWRISMNCICTHVNRNQDKFTWINWREIFIRNGKIAHELSTLMLAF